VAHPPIQLAPGALLLPAFARDALSPCIEAVAARAPFRIMTTPGGLPMSAAMTNCGPLGWISDRSGYRYSPTDPQTNLPWPAMPHAFLDLAASAARLAGFPNFIPDACLINRYAPGAKMSLHQDKDEHDFSQPIVSVSLGLPAVFLFGGFARSETPARIPLHHGDVVVWGGPARLRYHGVLPIKPGLHPFRFNLTLRSAA
jgi:alkylated DNA repair protein (DNA oxidative demethylase)